MALPGQDVTALMHMLNPVQAPGVLAHVAQYHLKKAAQLECLHALPIQGPAGSAAELLPPFICQGYMHTFAGTHTHKRRMYHHITSSKLTSVPTLALQPLQEQRGSWLGHIAAQSLHPAAG